MSEVRAKYQASNSKMSQSSQIETQNRELKAEVALWKKRYMETELRLKDFDELRMKCDQLMNGSKLQNQEWSKKLEQMNLEHSQ